MLFPGPNFVFCEWRCPLNRSVQMEKVLYIQLIPIIYFLVQGIQWLSVEYKFIKRYQAKK